MFYKITTELLCLEQKPVTNFFFQNHCHILPPHLTLKPLTLTLKPS